MSENRAEVKDRKQQKKKEKTNSLKYWLSLKVVKIILIIIVIALLILGIGKFYSTKSKTTKIGFEDIGELATQSARTTEISTIEGSRDLFGVEIPFTQSKYIFSYDVEIKAGFDFTQIEWSLNDHTIEVKLPEAKILSSELDLDSFEVYLEDESIFREITLDETNEAKQELMKTAEEDAIANGLLDNAGANAETILTGFFAGVYDMDEYEIVFTDK